MTSAEALSRLLEAGLSEGQARRKAALLGTAEALLESPAAARFFVPGRIEVLGKHTDYAGGRSLLAATERGFCVAAAPRPERIVRLSFAGGETFRWPLDSDLPAAEASRAPHAAAVVRRVARDFPGLRRGADVAFASDLPASAGLSSSSALVVGLFAALAASLQIEDREDFRAIVPTLEDRAGYLGAVESGRGFGPFDGERGAGARIGSEDHTAILCCRRGELAQYAFLPVRRERALPLPPDWIFLVASSGVAADKAGPAAERYNLLARSAEAILEIGCPGAASLGGACAREASAAARIRQALIRGEHPDFPPGFLLRRFEQFFEESFRLVPAAAGALASGDVRALGPICDRSQALAERALGNQIPQTIHLARAARELGAAAASAFGAGFGGSVWALVERAQADELSRRWRETYARAFERDEGRCEIFATRPGPAAQTL